MPLTQKPVLARVDVRKSGLQKSPWLVEVVELPAPKALSDPEVSRELVRGAERER